MPEFVDTGTLVKCINYLQAFEQGGAASEFDSVALCRQGLQGIFSNLGSYSNKIQSATFIHDCFRKNLSSLESLADADVSAEKTDTAASLNDLCFAMIEEMAVLMRERYLREGGKDLSVSEKAVTDYFESSGNWYIGDTTMVSEYYFVKLPVTVIDGMLHNFADSSNQSVSSKDGVGESAYVESEKGQRPSLR